MRQQVVKLHDGKEGSLRDKSSHASLFSLYDTLPLLQLRLKGHTPFMRSWYSMAQRTKFGLVSDNTGHARYGTSDLFVIRARMVL